MLLVFGRTPRLLAISLRVRQYIERTCAKLDEVTGDDALADARDLVVATLRCCIIEVVRRLLETGEHERARLHLVYSMPIDAEHFSFEGHDVGEQLLVTDVDLHTVRLHRVSNLIDDCLSCRLNTENIFHVNDVVRFCLGEVYTGRHHDLLERWALTFDK